MSEPRHRFLGARHDLSGRLVGPRNHDHRQAEFARDFDLGVRGAAAGILGHNNVDLLVLEQMQLGITVERSPLAQQNEIGKAQQSFERSIELRPGYSDALNNYGVLLVREQRYSDAEEKFRSCIQINPKFDQAYLNLARLYVVLNQKDKAREVLESLLRQQPEHAMAQQALKMLE